MIFGSSIYNDKCEKITIYDTNVFGSVCMHQAESGQTDTLRLRSQYYMLVLKCFPFATFTHDVHTAL